MASTSDKEWMRASFLGGAQITIRLPKGTKVGLLDAALGGQSEAEFGTCFRVNKVSVRPGQIGVNQLPGPVRHVEIEVLPWATRRRRK
jgi:hypothetical protein